MGGVVAAPSEARYGAWAGARKAPASRGAATYWGALMLGERATWRGEKGTVLVLGKRATRALALPFKVVSSRAAVGSSSPSQCLRASERDRHHHPVRRWWVERVVERV